jgi:hypothetical protein
VEAITEFEAAVKKGGETSRAEQRVKTALDGFDLELRSLPDVGQGALRKELASYRARLAQAQVDQSYRREEEQAQFQTVQQVGQAGDRLQEKTEAAYVGTVVALTEATALGIDVANTMEAQEDRMKQMNQDLDHIHLTLRNSRRLVNQIARNLANDKIIQVLGFIAFVMVIIMIVLAVTGKDEGQLEVPDQIRRERGSGLDGQGGTGVR